MITIGIATYQRLESLRTLISQLKTHTTDEFNLIVSVDGSDDGTVDYLKENQINYIYSENRGVGHAKNLIMAWFYEHTTDDVLIMMEDDCRVWEDDWSKDWVYIAYYFKYVNYYDGQQTEKTKLFNISPAPMMVKHFGAQVMAMHREVIAKVGFIDPTLVRYGFEHVEWAARVYQEYKTIWQGDEDCVPCFNKHVGVIWENSNFDLEVFISNWRKAIDLLNSGQSVFRYPYDTQEQRAHFNSCLSAAVIYKDPKPHLVAGQVCPLCGCKGRYVGKKGEYPLRECCGVLLSFPYKDAQEYERLYQEDSIYHDAEQRLEGQPPFFERDDEYKEAALARLRMINNWIPLTDCQKGLIDIGAGTGAFVETATKLGVPSIGIEPNREMVEFAQRFMRDVRLASWQTLDSAMLNGPCASLITAFDVFEHLVDPVGFLTAMHVPLLPGGMLVIEMPELGCPQQKAEDLNWKHIRPRQHVCLYSDPAAQKIFAKGGWKVEAMHRPLRGRLGKVSYFLSPA